jgi:hypothetical protein
MLRCEYSPEAVKDLARNWKDPGGDQGAIPEDEQQQPSDTRKRPRTESTHAVAVRSQKQHKFVVVSAKAHTYNPSKQLAFEDQLLRAFISAGWSFNSITDPEVQRLFHDWIPGATIPTRHRFSNGILDRQATKIQGEIKVALKGQYATVQCDGWRDVSKKHLVAFMYTAGRKVCCILSHLMVLLKDFVLERHT